MFDRWEQKFKFDNLSQTHLLREMPKRCDGAAIQLFQREQQHFFDSYCQINKPIYTRALQMSFKLTVPHFVKNMLK